MFSDLFQKQEEDCKARALCCLKIDEAFLFSPPLRFLSGLSGASNTCKSKSSREEISLHYLQTEHSPGLSRRHSTVFLSWVAVVVLISSLFGLQTNVPALAWPSHFPGPLGRAHRLCVSSPG